MENQNDEYIKINNCNIISNKGDNIDKELENEIDNNQEDKFRINKYEKTEKEEKNKKDEKNNIINENNNNNIINDEKINKININEEKKNKKKRSINIENKEDEKINNEMKDDNISENDNETKDDISIGTNSNHHFSSKILNLNSEVDLDKIIAGKDENLNNIPNLNDNLEYKIDEKYSEEDELEENQNLNVNYYLGNIFRDVVNKKKNETKDLRPSIYNKNLNDEKKNVNFGEIINAQLNEIKDNTLSYFDKIIKEFEKRYTDYINNMTKYVNENALKISKVFENLENDENILEFADNKIFKQFDSILEIHENIFNAIEDHVGLLRLFLGQTDLVQQKNPLEYFINNNSNDILKCWFLNKINFQKLNLSNVILNKDLSELCSRYLCKKKDNNFSSITIKKDIKGNLSLESDFVRENLNNLEKLKFKNVKSEEINSIFINKNNQTNKNKNNDKNEEDMPSANKLSSLSIIESDFSSINLIKISTPELKKLKIKRTPLTYSLKFFFDSILGKTLFLQNLSLQKCFLDDQSLYQIFLFFIEKPQLVESLQNISFSGNEITMVDMKCLNNKNCIFKSLQYLDFSKNNIYEFFTDNFKVLPKINILDLTDNNISNYLFFEALKLKKKEIQSIVLLSNNLFVNNNKTNAIKYRQYLYDNLIKFKHKLKKLNFSFLYNKKTINQLLELRISPMVKISLIKLDLSYCSLSDENVCNFMKNNIGLLNLQVLNLNNNYITIKIFSLILKIDISLEKLKSLDLSMNNINSLSIEEYVDIGKFIDKHSALKKIKFQDSTFCQDLLLLSQIEKKKCDIINNKLISRGIKFIVEKEYNILIVPLKKLFDLKDKEL